MGKRYRSRFLSGLIFGLVVFLHVQKGYAQGISTVAGFPYCETFTESVTRANTVYGGDAYMTSGNGDSDGAGVLRLTEAEDNQSGYVYVDVPFSSTYGIKASFEYFSYGGDGADGIAFYLFDAAIQPEEFRIGGFGGSLGYAQKDAVEGLKGGYLGIGFDEYGNFSDQEAGKTGGPGRDAQSVTVRGPENAGAGPYPYVDHANVEDEFGFTIDADRITRPETILDDGYRKVFIDLQPDGNGQFTITVKMMVTHSDANLEGETFIVIDSVPFPYDAPEFLKAGFSASTGGSDNYHEIRNVIIEVSDGESLTKPIAQPKAVEACLGQVNVFEIDAVNDVEITNENGTIRCLQIYENLADISTEPIDICLNEQCDPTNQTLGLGSGVFVTDSEGGTVTFTSDASFVEGEVTIYYTVTDTYGITSDARPITVTIKPSPEVPEIAALGSPQFYEGDEVELEVTNYSAIDTYQWFFEGVEIDGEVGSSYIASQTGSYNIKVTNEWGCSEFSTDVLLDFNPAPDIIVTEGIATAEECQNEGSISFTVSNTFEDDFFRVIDSIGTVIRDWAPIAGNPILIDNLGGGEYKLEIYDRYRPMADPFQHDFVIADERQIIITPIVRNVQCFGDDPVGSIRFEVKTIGCGSNNIRVSYKHQEDAIFTPEATIGLGGGKSEYINYLDGTINFPIGVYDFKVRQGGGNCTDCGILNYKVTVGGPPSALEIDEYDIAVQDVTCSGTTYYQATANPTGGWGGYTYLWSDGQTTKTATYLSPGNTYTVTVTDAGGCVVEATKTMPGNNSITMTITAELTDPVCGAFNGAIAVTYTDIDFNDYTVTWMKDNPDSGTAVSGTQNGIGNLSPGNYFLILTDKINPDCKIIREYTLMEQGTPVSVDPSDQEICEGESVVFTPSIAAPTGNYTFHWYHDINKIDPVIDNADLGPQEVVYDLDASGILTITGLSFDGTDNTYSYFIDVSGDGVCETPAGELTEVTVAVNPTPGPPNVSVQGGHSRNF